MEEIRPTSWYVWQYPIIYWVSYIPGGAGFQPSTVRCTKTKRERYLQIAPHPLRGFFWNTIIYVVTLFASIHSSTVHPTKTEKNTTTHIHTHVLSPFFRIMQFLWLAVITGTCLAMAGAMASRADVMKPVSKRYWTNASRDNKTWRLPPCTTKMELLPRCNYNPNWNPYFRWEEKMMDRQCLVGESCFIKSWGEICERNMWKQLKTTWNDRRSPT